MSESMVKPNEDNEDIEEFFDANDVFVDGKDIYIKPEEKKEETNPQSQDRDWFGLKRVWDSTIKWINAEDEEMVRKKREEMFISIKEDDKSNEEVIDNQTSTDRSVTKDKSDEKVTKIEIISDNKSSDELTDRKTEVTVVNEEDIHIDPDDIEMKPLDSIKFLVNIIAVLVLNLFIICGTAHWIYNYLEGIDWYLKGNTFFNFHIFFMSLGFCGLGIGILVNRMFRGWSSGAINCLHTTLTLMTLIFFVIGFYAVIVSLNNLNSVHFYSVHSCLGLLSIIAIFLVWIFGFVVYIFPRFVPDIQMLLIPIHSFFGRVVFTLICATAISGISDKLRISDLKPSLGPIGLKNINDSVYLNGTVSPDRVIDKYWNIPDEAILCNLIAFIILLFAFFVTFLVSNEDFRRRLLPEEYGIEIKTRLK